MSPTLAPLTTTMPAREIIATPLPDKLPSMPTPLAPLSDMASKSKEEEEEEEEGTALSPFTLPSPEYTEPLYTEINIPLPPAPKPKKTQPKTRPKAHSFSSFKPFHRRQSSSESRRKSGEEEWPRIRKEVKNREVAAAMDLKSASRHRRSGTVDALAVVPAVLVLSAELFTPGEGGARRKGGGRWEDGMI